MLCLKRDSSSLHYPKRSSSRGSVGAYPSCHQAWVHPELVASLSHSRPHLWATQIHPSTQRIVFGCWEEDKVPRENTHTHTHRENMQCQFYNCFIFLLVLFYFSYFIYTLQTFLFLSFPIHEVSYCIQFSFLFFNSIQYIISAKSETGSSLGTLLSA